MYPHDGISENRTSFSKLNKTTITPVLKQKFVAATFCCVNNLKEAGIFSLLPYRDWIWGSMSLISVCPTEKLHEQSAIF
jgi:hypothetical protein